jgi:hypothetical protein
VGGAELGVGGIGLDAGGRGVGAGRVGASVGCGAVQATIVSKVRSRLSRGDAIALWLIVSSVEMNLFPFTG